MPPVVVGFSLLTASLLLQASPLLLATMRLEGIYDADSVQILLAFLLLLAPMLLLEN
jgi:hypothetical protein